MSMITEIYYKILGVFFKEDVYFNRAQLSYCSIESKITNRSKD